MENSLTWVQDNGTLLTLLAFLGALYLGFLGVKLWMVTIYTVFWFWLLDAHPALWVIVGIPLLVLNIVPLRRLILSAPVVLLLKKLNILPEISETEQVALEAGTTWVDKELFSGKPNFTAISKNVYGKLKGEEKAFIDVQCEKLCSLMTDWDIFQKGDLSPEVWAYIKKEKFFGLVIPKEHGGLGFSALANSEVVSKIASRSMPLAVTVMVPNSLGPGELISHYGTAHQKEYYLPRLADGRELPCFALTEAHAGSDAGGMTSYGVVFKGEDGKLYIRLNWSKRYITLAAVATLLGMAIKLRDPDNLLGKGKDPGITCVLVPHTTPGVVLGQRHNPMGVPFYNCPTEGKDVVISADQIIGGPEFAGRGWQMLMECLAIGRSISLPAQSAGSAKMILRVAGAYAAIRKQFGIEIGRFEGIEEPLARIGGLSYLLEASRIFTVGAVDSGIKPAVVSAIAKYNSTEIARQLINDGMDILAGAAISRGPRNLLANAYIATPIGITVEGANILTRSLMIFGQGAIRCHPYAYSEVKALQSNDTKAFDKAFWAHIGFVIRNGCRALLLSLTRGYLAGVPSGPCKRYYQKLSWASATFSFMSDLALGSYGGALKLRESITGRYADVLSWMYMATAVIQRFEAEGRQAEHKPYVDWALQHCFMKIQTAFEGIFDNIEVPLIRFIFRGPVAFWSRLNSIGMGPDDKLSHKVAQGICRPGALRDALGEGVYLPSDPHEALARYEQTLKLVYEASAVFQKVSRAVKEKKLPKGKPERLVQKALDEGIITRDEFHLVQRAEAAREDAIQVDSFRLEDFQFGLLTDKPKEAVRA